MMLDHPASSAVARTPMTATRAQSIVIISRRRSTRSTSTPPGRANSSQGSQAAPRVAETISGFLVCAATKSGAAIVARPLPRAEVVLAVHSFANRAPRGSATSSDATGTRAAVRPPSIAAAIWPDRVILPEREATPDAQDRAARRDHLGGPGHHDPRPHRAVSGPRPGPAHAEPGRGPQPPVGRPRGGPGRDQEQVGPARGPA